MLAKDFESPFENFLRYTINAKRKLRDMLVSFVIGIKETFSIKMTILFNLLTMISIKFLEHFLLIIGIPKYALSTLFV